MTAMVNGESSGGEGSGVSMRVNEVPESDWELWRDLRLEALADSPTAFGETLAMARTKSEEDWRSWWDGRPDAGPRYIASVDGSPAGMCSICFPEDHDKQPLLISMWTSPKARGRGVGRAMLDACVAYCRREGHPQFRLGVVNDNLSALRMYKRYGFTLTGGSEPLFSDPSKLVLWMAISMHSEAETEAAA
jgi:ribosomal protein S18 acetylase RimI-like enzyme